MIDTIAAGAVGQTTPRSCHALGARGADEILPQHLSIGRAATVRAMTPVATTDKAQRGQGEVAQQRPEIPFA